MEFDENLISTDLVGYLVKTMTANEISQFRFIFDLKMGPIVWKLRLVFFII